MASTVTRNGISEFGFTQKMIETMHVSVIVLKRTLELKHYPNVKCNHMHDKKYIPDH